MGNWVHIRFKLFGVNVVYIFSCLYCVFVLLCIPSVSCAVCCLWIVPYVVCGLCRMLSVSCAVCCLWIVPYVVCVLCRMFSVDCAVCCLWIVPYVVCGLCRMLSVDCGVCCLWIVPYGFICGCEHHQRKTICLYVLFLISDKQCGTEDQYLFSGFLGVSMLQLLIIYSIYDYDMLTLS